MSRPRHPQHDETGPDETASLEPGRKPGPELRDLDAIDAELTAVRAELRATAPRIEAERVKQEKQAVKIANEERRWKTLHDADQPFDPDSFEPPLRPYEPDPKLHRQYHKLHYQIARLEKERTAAARLEAGY
jgi:hypothetical protein